MPGIRSGDRCCPYGERKKVSRGGGIKRCDRRDIQSQDIRRAVFLPGYAVALVFLVIGIRMVSVLVVRTSVQLADLLDKAYHRLMVVVRHHSGKEHHQHRHQDRKYSEFPEHQYKSNDYSRLCNLVAGSKR